MDDGRHSDPEARAGNFAASSGRSDLLQMVAIRVNRASTRRGEIVVVRTNSSDKHVRIPWIASRYNYFIKKSRVFLPN